MHKEELKDQCRQLMGHYPTGVTIVTTMDWKKNIPSGLTVNSFTSVSMEPTLVLFCVDKSATSLSSFQQANRFAVHLLASDQEKECFEFASKSKDKFSQVHFHISKRGLPIIESALGVMECKDNFKG